MTEIDVASSRVPALRPPLKWAGGKRWQIPHLAPIWAAHASRRLVEPFCGGLAVALSLQPSRALINDVNPHLVSFYRWLRRGLKTTERMENDERLYYAHRARFNELIRTGAADSVEGASLFYFLNRTAYNGLCRFNRTGEFNVPFGAYRRITYVDDFTHYRPLLSTWDFTCSDFADVPLAASDFVYADPPYDVEFTSYSSRGFSWADQVRTAERFAAHPGPVVLVNQATDRIIELYTRLGYVLRYLSAPRRIACTGDRTRAHEVMALRNLVN